MNNKDLNLSEILKDCPKGAKFWSPMFGDVFLMEIRTGDFAPIVMEARGAFDNIVFYNDGRYYDIEGAECVLFPSKDNRDWDAWKPAIKFNNPYIFDPRTFKPFDKVLVRRSDDDVWRANIFAFYDGGEYVSCINEKHFRQCVSYDAETIHYINTSREVPLYYRWWEE